MQICGFGLAKWQQYSTAETKSRSQRCAVVTHIPPENWRDVNAHRTVKSDVYSFAIMLWELLTEQVAFAGRGWFLRAVMVMAFIWLIYYHYRC